MVKKRRKKHKPELDEEPYIDEEEDEFDLDPIDYFDIPEVWKTKMFKEARKLAKKRKIETYVV